MITKRELLKDFANGLGCKFVKCSTCPYKDICYSKSKSTNMGTELEKIGAMALLRMFRKKKKPLLSVGTKIKFDDGSIAKIESTTAGPELCFYKINGYTFRSLSYLLGRTWEIVE